MLKFFFSKVPFHIHKTSLNLLSGHKSRGGRNGSSALKHLGFAFVSACIDDAGGGIEQSSMQEGS